MRLTLQVLSLLRRLSFFRLVSVVFSRVQIR